MTKKITFLSFKPAQEENKKLRALLKEMIMALEQANKYIKHKEGFVAYSQFGEKQIEKAKNLLNLKS